MKCNIGKTERLIRIVTGILLVGAGIFIGGLWALLGVAVMMTAIVSWCPARAVFGRSSCRTDESLPADTSGQHNTRTPQNRRFK